MNKKRKTTIYKTILISIALSLFTACASKQEIIKTKDTTLISYDEKAYAVKNSYQDSKQFVKKSYSTVTNYFNNTSDDFYENSFIQFISSDETILEKRKNLIIWKDGNSKNSSYIIKNYLKNNKKDVDYKGLNLAQKMKILNDYFFNMKQKEYLAKFTTQYKKPNFDEYKTDRENIEVVNNYNYQLSRSKYEWENNLQEIKKEIAQNILSSLYGKPTISNISYDPNNQLIYMQINSQRESFSQKVSFKVLPEYAKTIKNNKRSLLPKVYFKFENNEITLIGSSVMLKKKEYLANFTNKLYQRENTLTLSNNNKLDLKKLNVNYKINATDIKNPEWFYNLPEEGKIIGYGTGETESAAKNSALNNIAQTLEVDVKSDISINKKSDGSQYSSRTKQNINVSSKSKKLKGTKTIKSQKKDGIWFIAVSY
ncbi:MAG: hypothetical protein DRG78_22560 [Epsilonproteobacteria bacterium]|nr:MAG: hypothetical protein DRG78_22560 [Campylobacterota bacterium]